MIIDAIILARGGSKGIPRKNIVEVAGKPLVAWTIETARSSVWIRDAVVSTDSQDIAEIASHFGARVPALRPDDIAGDLSMSEDALRHALDHLCRHPRPDAFVFPQVTSPARGPHLFDRAIDAFRAEGCDSMFSATLIRNFIWRGGRPLTPMYDPETRPMRQNLAPEQKFYRENGNFYIARSDGFLASSSRLFGNIAMFETSEEEAVEIDEWEDIAPAEAALRATGQAAEFG